MSEPQLILDYASPRKRGKVRLPATSRLDVSCGPDGSVRVVETLIGHAWAAAAVTFGAFVAFTLAFGAVSETRWILGRRHLPIDFLSPALMALLAVVELTLIVLVIRNTWRRTMLSADAKQVTLEFTAPLKRLWRREWTTEEVGEIVLILTQAETDAVQLAELRLRPAGLLINLFTDHRAMDLEPIARKLNRAMAGDPPEVEPMRAQLLLQPEVQPPDPRTLQRLRERREGLQGRLH